VGQILQGRYDRLLRRTTAQVGFGSKVGEALEDLFPTLDVEQAPMELLRASGWKFGSGRVIRVAAAGTENAIQLFNPVGSGQLIVLTHLMVSVGAATDITYGPTFVALTDASVAGSERDTRAGAISPTVGLLQRQDDGVASAFGLFRGSTTIPQILDDQNGLAVLAPGTGWIIHAAALAQTIRSSWMWRERVAEPEELGF